MVDQSSRSHTCLSLSSRFVASCVSWEQKSTVRLVHLAFCMEVVMRERAGSLLQNEREKLGKSISRKYLIGFSLRFVRYLWVGASLVLACAERLCTLSLLARVRSLQDESKKGNENERKVSPSPGNLFLRFVGCWGLLAQAFFETVRGQGLVEPRNRKKRE